MRDHNQAGSLGANARQQQFKHNAGSLTIEISGGFIGQQAGRFADQRPGNRRPLPLAARKLAGPVREAVAAFKLGHAQDSLRLHQSERWREQLLAGDDALQDFLAAHVDVDIQQLRSLVRAARKDAANVPEKRSGRAFRELFQFIKAAQPVGDE